MPETTAEKASVTALQKAFPKAVISVLEKAGDTFVCVETASIENVARYLKDNPAQQFDYFVECVGVDYSTWKHERDLQGRFEVVYNLFSTSRNERLFLKVAVDDGTAVPSLVPVYLGAEYPEREIQDLLGVTFKGNGPVEGQRFLLPDDWVGHPLRKNEPLGGEDVVFHEGMTGPAVEDVQTPHTGESWEGKTSSRDVSGR